MLVNKQTSGYKIHTSQFIHKNNTARGFKDIRLYFQAFIAYCHPEQDDAVNFNTTMQYNNIGVYCNSVFIV